jgi:hypothetical protein
MRSETDPSTTLVSIDRKHKIPAMVGCLTMKGEAAQQMFLAIISSIQVTLTKIATYGCP